MFTTITVVIIIISMGRIGAPRLSLAGLRPPQRGLGAQGRLEYIR